MGNKEIIKKIKAEERIVLSEKLTDVLLEAKDGVAVPSSLAKIFLFKWQQDQLSSEEGITILLKAAMKADEERSRAILEEIGVRGV